MDKDLPDLGSNADSKKRRPLLLDLVKDGVSKEVGGTEFKLNRKKAEIITSVGDALVELAIDRDKQARAKARMPLMGGNLEVEASRSPEGNRRIGMQFRKQF